MRDKPFSAFTEEADGRADSLENEVELELMCSCTSIKLNSSVIASAEGTTFTCVTRTHRRPS